MTDEGGVTTSNPGQANPQIPVPNVASGQRKKTPKKPEAKKYPASA